MEKSRTASRAYKLNRALLLVTLSSVLGFAQPPASEGQPTAPPDVIVFTNGEQLTGDLTVATGDSVTFKSAMAGDITVKWDNIKELRTSKPFAVLTKNQKLKVSEAAQSVAQGNLVKQDKDIQVTTNAGPKSIPLAEDGSRRA